MKRILLLVLSLLLLCVHTAQAVEDPLAVPNNKFGIHITHKEDLAKAAELVNSTGGDWGYVTFVIREDNRDVKEWQEMFDAMRSLHLIPIVRIATRAEGSNWKRPIKEDVDSWVQFLDQLHWVVKNRYVILFNEPNHAKEWGGNIDPKNYAEVTRTFAEGLKKSSDNYFILPAAVDLAADNNGNTLEASRFFHEVYLSDNKFYTLFDGWNSHSYPNPNFSASPQNSGQKSIRGYQWELQTLKQYGLKDSMPIFITETGWQHRDGKTYSSHYLGGKTVASYMQSAYLYAFSNPKIVAVTPFILNYSEPPFDRFRWVTDSGEPLPVFTTIQAMSKTAGTPVQDNTNYHIQRYLPDTLIAGNTYLVALRFLNTGQVDWNSSDILVIDGNMDQNLISVQPIDQVKPFESAVFWITIHAPEDAGEYILTAQMQHQGKLFGEAVPMHFTVVTQANVFIRTKLWLQRILHPGDFFSQ